MERWKTIEDYPNYEASDMGKIRNKKSQKILKEAMQNNGYKIVSLRKDGHTNCLSVHRLVAKTWKPLDNYEGLLVNHIDYDKTNNCINNLEWVTPQQNCLLGTGPNELKVLKAIVNNAMNKAINEWYERILTLRISKEAFADAVVENAVKNATELLK